MLVIWWNVSLPISVPPLTYMYDITDTVPSFVNKNDVKALSDRLQFRQKVDNYVIRHGTFRALYQLNLATQSAYFTKKEK